MDHNATAITDEEVYSYLTNNYGNPSSLHAEGQKARHIVETARSNIIKVFNAQDAELVFTSSGTEANNMFFNSFTDYHHIISAIEHPSVLYSAIQPIFIAVNSAGITQIENLHSIIQNLPSKKFVVSVMLANNETGVIQPIKKIAQLVKEHGGIIHTDAVQGCGKIPIDMEDLGIDSMTVSAHKFGGCIGVGALIFKKNMNIKSLIMGGGQEKKLRSGTENVAAIAAFEHVAMKIPSLIEQMKSIVSLRNLIEDKICSACSEVKIFGKDSTRLPNTSCITMPHVTNDIQLMYFDLQGISLGKGSACSSGILDDGSHVLQAMGIIEQERRQAIRISLGYNNSGKDVNKLVKVWEMLYTKD